MLHPGKSAALSNGHGHILRFEVSRQAQVEAVQKLGEGDVDQAAAEMEAGAHRTPRPKRHESVVLSSHVVGPGRTLVRCM